MKTVKERGEASILIKLHNGNITVVHGTDKVVLKEFKNVPKGSWESIWASLTQIEKSTK